MAVNMARVDTFENFLKSLSIHTFHCPSSNFDQILGRVIYYFIFSDVQIINASSFPMFVMVSMIAATIPTNSTVRTPRALKTVSLAPVDGVSPVSGFVMELTIVGMRATSPIACAGVTFVTTLSFNVTRHTNAFQGTGSVTGLMIAKMDQMRVRRLAQVYETFLSHVISHQLE